MNAELGRLDLRVSWRFISQSAWAIAPDAQSVGEFPVAPERGYMDVFAPGRHANSSQRPVFRP